MVLESYSGTTTGAKTYVRGINYISVEDETGNKGYYLYNGHGDVVQLVDNNANIINQKIKGDGTQ